MAEYILMTALSPTMETGKIASWNKKEGDSVASGDVLCEVETDKASIDYESTQEGTILKILVAADGSAAVGDPIAILGEAGESIKELVATAATATSESEKPEPEEKEVPTDSVTVVVVEPEKKSPKAPEVPVGDGSRVKASPLARKLAAERHIDLSIVKGSGPEGRIVKADVEAYRGVPSALVSRVGTTVSASARAVPGEDIRIPVEGVRAVIAKRLSESKFSAPHFYLKNSVDMEATTGARKVLNRSAAEKVSLNAFFIKFVAEALKRHPAVNAGWMGDHILQFGSIDIGLAVDLGNGLITPVVRNCGNKGVVEIDAELKVLIEKAREGKLAPSEYTGAGFTISNLGSFGIEEFTAIINPPGAAILAIGKTVATPVVDESGDLVVADLMKMTLSCDHRVIDGATGARFLDELKSLMENPVRLIY